MKKNYRTGLYSTPWSCTATLRLTRAPFMSHIAHTDLHWAWEKQPEKSNHSSLADFDYEIG